MGPLLAVELDLIVVEVLEQAIESILFCVPVLFSEGHFPAGPVERGRHLVPERATAPLAADVDVELAAVAVAVCRSCGVEFLREGSMLSEREFRVELWWWRGLCPRLLGSGLRLGPRLGCLPRPSAPGR